MPPEKKADYDVGRNRPPVHSRFKPGQSGNPRGRPKGSKNFDTRLDEIFNQKIPATGPDGKRRSMTKREAGMTQLANRFAKGEPQAIKQVLELERKREARRDAEATRRGHAETADDETIAALKFRLSGPEEQEV